MTYELEVVEHLHKLFKKMAKREKYVLDAIENKVREIRENPYHYKPLGAPMQNMRRVHIMGSFVLVYSIDESRKTVVLHKFAYHDEAYH